MKSEDEVMSGDKEEGEALEIDSGLQRPHKPFNFNPSDSNLSKVLQVIRKILYEFQSHPLKNRDK
jgi:hypothetical protein